MSQETHETATLPTLLWLPEMKAILDDVDAGRRPSILAAGAIYVSVHESILTGKVPDLGQLFNYLWARDSPVMPVAIPFKPIEGSNLVCVDYATNEPRRYGYDLQLADQARAILDERGMTAAEHARILAHETGVLRHDKPAHADKVKRTDKIKNFLRRLLF